MESFSAWRQYLYPANREALFLSLYETDLPDGVIFRLAAQARPAILLATAESDEDAISLGASKIGGRPDLPRGSAWPTRPPYPDAGQRAEGHRKEADRLLADSRKPRSWMTPEQGDRFSREYKARADSIEAEFPLAFFAQVDLFELSKEEGFDPAFPSEGRLLVFYDFWEQPEDFTPEASVGWQVIWDKTPHAELVRVPFPAALSSISSDEWTCIFRAARISARTVLTPIPPNDKSWDAFPLDDDEALEAYQEWLEQFRHAPMRSIATIINSAASHRRCRKLLKFAGDWQLVLQIGVDRHAGIPHPGAYYVIMRKEDIAARRFDRARVTYQCD